MKAFVFIANVRKIKNENLKHVQCTQVHNNLGKVLFCRFPISCNLDHPFHKRHTCGFVGDWWKKQKSLFSILPMNFHWIIISTKCLFTSLDKSWFALLYKRARIRAEAFAVFERKFNKTMFEVMSSTSLTFAFSLPRADSVYVTEWAHCKWQDNQNFENTF